MDVVELRDPRALMVPAMQTFLKRALESNALLTPYGFDAVAPDMFDMIVNPTKFMFVGAENGDFKALTMGFLPDGNLFPFPTISLFYNEGSRELSRAIRADTMDFVVSHGYTRLLAVNSSGNTDKAWLRGLTPEGATADIIGSLVMFEVE